MAQPSAAPSAADLEQSSDGKNAYFDVNADAVWNNGEVPERPIRLTFDRAGTQGASPVWKFKSVEELAPCVKSKALDRQPETPKRNAPWPDRVSGVRIRLGPPEPGGPPRVTATPQYDQRPKFFDGLGFSFSLFWGTSGQFTHVHRKRDARCLSS